MAEPRLATGIWVSAYLRRCSAELIPAYVTARGDETAGAVLVRVDALDGTSRVMQRQYDLLAGTRVWVALAQGSEAEVSEVVRRARRADPDLWVIDIESPSGRDLLDDPGLALG